MSAYDVITDRICKLIEAGTVPWRKPWKSRGELPANLISRKVYRGVNLFLLACAKYDSPYWLTFKQAKELGGTVKKGEHGFPVVFWKFPNGQDDDGDEDRKTYSPFMKYYTVFNAAQVEGVETPPPVHVESLPHEPIERCRQVIADMPKCPPIVNDFNYCGYNAGSDILTMPPIGRFETPEHYYASLFHELIHATGHESRLARKGITDKNQFGDPDYSREELIAEMGSAFLCANCEIDKPTVENSAAYIDGWLKVLKADTRLIPTAAAQAQKAADFVLNVKYGE